MYKNLKQNIKVNEEKLTKLKEEKNRSTITVGEFDILLSIITRTTSQTTNINLKKNLINTINQLVLIKL